MSNIEWFKYCWVWEKDKATGHLNANIQPMLNYEDIAVFGNGSIRYFPQIDKKPVANIRPVSRRAPTDSYGKYNESADRLIPLGMSFPKRILNFYTTNHGERGYHPTQKPVALLAYLIRTYTNEGETILDNTMGSGSTIVAAIQEGRNAIGIERDADYFAIAQQRCLEATYQPSLFTPQPTQWEPVAMFGDD
jgi:DNA modification methylase